MLHPRYLAIMDKWQGMKAQYREIDQTMRVELMKTSSLHKRRSNAAHAMVFGLDSPVPCAGPTVDVNALREEREVLGLAIALAEKEVSVVRGEVSIEICNKVRDDYIAANVAVWKALRDLSPVLKREKAILAGLTDGGVSTGSLPMISVGLSVDGLVEYLAKQLQEHFGVDPAAE